MCAIGLLPHVFVCSVVHVASFAISFGIFIFVRLSLIFAVGWWDIFPLLTVYDDVRVGR